MAWRGAAGVRPVPGARCPVPGTWVPGARMLGARCLGARLPGGKNSARSARERCEIIVKPSEIVVKLILNLMWKSL